MISLKTRYRCDVLDIPNTYQTLIGPFISDVDTTPLDSGKVYYERSDSPSLLSRARDDIRLTYRDETFNPTLLIIATYDHVGYYPAKTNEVGAETTCFARSAAAARAHVTYTHVCNAHMHRSIRFKSFWQPME